MIESHLKWSIGTEGDREQVLSYEFPPQVSRSFATLGSNVAACEMAATFVQGIHHFCALIGPSGWGKTHLMQSILQGVTQNGNSSAQLLVTSAWLSTHPRAEQIPILLLDHAEDAFSQARTRQALRTLMERRVRLGKPTFLSFTQEQKNGAVRQLLQGRDWVIAEIQRPTRPERVHVVEQLARNHILQLSDKLIGLVARRVVGNGNSLEGALSRLELCGKEWKLPSEELRALGILEPLLSMRKGWDLRDHVAEVAQRVSDDPSEAEGLAAYAMVRWLHLHESDVAAYFGSHTNDLYTSLKKYEGEGDPRLHLLFQQLHQSIDRI